ncbi:FAD synthetase [Pukyongiella litopenaei]|uniref:FAD synthase n=1 Tax=Pukyongiella litopenaei TaxID=2605946 RepID=A0A2S0MP13_9RHOB|nr:FAD synthetase [Pukyongiella litopenaei]AVO37491.1 FAD synthetase [Pukyongiella litopenaei]
MFDQPNSTIWHRDVPRLDASIVTLGAFDGVHSGHQALISGAVSRARASGVPSVVCTFDPPPKVFFGRAAQLCPLAEKLARISALAPDHVVVFSFDETLRSMTPAAFMARLSRLSPQEIRVGGDFRFGAKQAGDVDLLATRFPVRIEPPVCCTAGEVVSSTRIRGLLEQGRHAAAEALLRPGLGGGLAA